MMMLCDCLCHHLGTKYCTNCVDRYCAELEFIKEKSLVVLKKNNKKHNK